LTAWLIWLAWSGVTRRPVASIVSAASPSSVSLTATMRPSFTATSARRGGAPVPSTSVPPVINRSYMVSPLFATAPRRQPVQFAALSPAVR